MIKIDRLIDDLDFSVAEMEVKTMQGDSGLLVCIVKVFNKTYRHSVAQQEFLAMGKLVSLRLEVASYVLAHHLYFNEFMGLTEAMGQVRVRGTRWAVGVLEGSSEY